MMICSNAQESRTEMKAEGMVQRRHVWNRNVARGKVRGREKGNGKKTNHNNGRSVHNKQRKSKKARGRWGKRRGWRKDRKGKRQGRSDLPPPLPYRFVNKTWDKGYQVCGPNECKIICNDQGLVCVDKTSRSAEGCNKHECVRLCGEQKKVEELNQKIYSAVICHQEEKCSEDNQKCERLSVDKKEVLADLSDTKRAVEGLADSLAKLINETETNLESLMMRGYSKLASTSFG